MKKTLSIIAALIVLTVIVFVLTIKFYITPERVREFLIPAAEKALNRKVNIDEVNISLFSGIEAKNFSIKEVDGKTDFLRSKEFVFKYQLLPLLSKKIVIDEFKLISPEIRLIRNSVGRFNFEDIGSQQASETEKEEEKTKTKPDSESAPLSLLVSKLIISDAKFYLNDMMNELPEIRGRIDLDTGITGVGTEGLNSMGEINLMIEQIITERGKLSDVASTLNYEISIDPLSGGLKIKESNIKLDNMSASITGELADLTGSPEINLIVAVPETDSVEIMKFAGLFADTGGIKLKGDLSAYIKIIVKPDETGRISSEGMIGLSKIEALYKEDTTAVDGKLHFRYSPNNLHIDKSDLMIQQIPISVKGDITDLDRTPKIDMGLTIAKSKASVLISAASPYIDTKDLKLSGDIKADLNLKGITSDLKNLKANGSVSLINIGLKYKELLTTIDSKLTVKESDLYIKKGGLSIEDVPLSISGSISNIISSPLMDISLNMPSTDASKIKKIGGAFAELQDISLSGRIGANIGLRGRPDKIETIKADGKLNIKNVRVKYDNFNALFDGDLKVSNDSMKINVWTSSGKNTILLKGSVKNLFKNQDMNLNIYSKKLYLDRIIPPKKSKTEATKGDKQKAVKKVKDGAETEPVPFDLGFRAKGVIKVGTAVYKEMTMKNYYLQYLLKDNKLTISQMKAESGKGKLNLKGSLDLSKKGYKYSFITTIDSLSAEPLVNSLFPRARDTIFGSLTTNLKLNGLGITKAALRKNLKADGSFKLLNGKITNNETTKNLSQLIGIKELETIKLTKAEGTVTINKGYANLDSIFVSDHIKTEPAGKIGLDETVDLEFDLRLSPKLTTKQLSEDITKYMVDDSGWGVIPVIVSGTLSKPDTRIDTEKALKRAANRAIKDIFRKKILKKKETETETAPEPLEELPIGEIIEGIFGTE